jgi:glycosyltransferase involved in cell wall biosynthesis
MCGDGELKDDARALGNELGLGERLVLPGWRRDIPDLLHAADVFALSSLFEGLPRSVLQAAVAGLPVVATAVNGTPEAVRNGATGFLVPAGRPDRMANRLVELLCAPAKARRMGRAGRKLIGAEFEITTMLRQIEDSYEELSDRKGLR